LIFWIWGKNKDEQLIIITIQLILLFPRS
jgi:hypothetical protein